MQTHRNHFRRSVASFGSSSVLVIFPNDISSVWLSNRSGRFHGDNSTTYAKYLSSYNCYNPVRVFDDRYWWSYSNRTSMSMRSNGSGASYGRHSNASANIGSTSWTSNLTGLFRGRSYIG